jgi:hypothetical protein
MDEMRSGATAKKPDLFTPPEAPCRTVDRGSRGFTGRYVESETVLRGDEHGVVAHLPFEHVGTIAAVTIEWTRSTLVGRLTVIVAACQTNKRERENQ